MIRIRYLIFLLAIGVSLTACSTMQKTDLFFGMDIPGGGQVSEKQWKNFSDSVIALRFPEGYTEWDAKGRWMDTKTGKTITENTKVVILVGKKGNNRNSLIDTITRVYIRQFKQQAVLRLDSRARVEFISSKR